MALVFGLVVFGPRVREELLPEPKSAWVAIQPAGAAEATVGQIEIDSGTSFRLHAVVEAVTRTGKRVYYTEAPGLMMDGVEVPAESIRRWNHPGDVVILWFTIEAYRAVHSVYGDQDVDDFRFEAMFRPGWGRGWSVTGSLAPRTGSLAQGAEEFGPFTFGTQRFHVRVESYPRGDGFAPDKRFASFGASDLPEQVARFPTVVAKLGGPLSHPSSIFGLAEVQVAEQAHQLTRERVGALIRDRLLFSKPTLLAQVLALSGVSWDELEWQPVDLEAGRPWEGDVGAGDLLRVGERVVFLYQDRGVRGQLDYDDLCFDYEKGAAVRTLREVFTGGGLVDWARLD